MMEKMKEMDKDGDGFLSFTELQLDSGRPEEMELVKKSFNLGDANKDGKLSSDELTVAWREYQKMATKLDDPEKDMPLSSAEEAGEDAEHDGAAGGEAKEMSS